MSPEAPHGRCGPPVFAQSVSSSITNGFATTSPALFATRTPWASRPSSVAGSLHEKMLTRADADGAVARLNKWGAAAAGEKLRLGYRIHGYEFVASPDGTLLDTLFKGTDPRLVDYEMDIFWVVRGGGTSVALLNRYGGQIRIVPLKDIRKGTPTGITTGEAPDEASVALGTGTIDWTQVMAAAVKARVKWYLIEDEHPEAVSQIHGVSTSTTLKF